MRTCKGASFTFPPMLQLNVNQPDAVRQAADILRRGGVIAAPTETVYGLMARWSDTRAHETIYRLKRRPAEKRLQMLASSLDDLAGCQLQLKRLDDARAIAARFWPGPLTLVVEATNGQTVGLRLPDHPFVLELIRELGEPLAATSANLSGQPPADNAVEAICHLDGQPDALVDGGRVTVTGGAASTVASIVGDGLTILRPGSISLAQLQSALTKQA